MSNILFQISSHKKIIDFFIWSAKRGYLWNYNIFRRAKDGTGKRQTDRQKLLITEAAMFWQDEVEGKRVLDSQEG